MSSSVRYEQLRESLGLRLGVFPLGGVEGIVRNRHLSRVNGKAETVGWKEFSIAAEFEPQPEVSSFERFFKPYL